MRTKHLLFTMVMASAFAACSNEDFVSEGNTLKDDKGLLVEIGPNFTIAATKEADATTRAYDQNAKFVWTPNEIETTDGSATTAATLGLCWTGVNNVNTEYSALPATDYRVFTNYKFEHRGWLFEGETEPNYDQCATDAKIKNGEFIPGFGTPVATWDASATTADDKELLTTAGKYSTTGGNKKLNFAAGFFKSNLGSIYQGEYIVYFPYTDEFFNGPVQASAPKEVELTNLKVAKKVDGKVQHDLNTWAAMSKHAFSVGYKNNMNGGVDAETFSTKTLSGGVLVRLTNSKSTLSKGIQTVTLYSKDKQFVLKQNLSASAIKAANNNSANYGKNLYYGEAIATSKTIVAKVYTTAGAALNPDKDSYVDIVIPALPASINDLTVLLTNEDNLSAEVKISGITEIKPVGQAWTALNDIDLSTLTFNKVYAMDEASFRVATNNENTSSAINLEKANSKTVRVLGEIELSADAPAIAIRAGYTIVGEAGDALIINGGGISNITAHKPGIENPRFIVTPAGGFDAEKMYAPVLDCNVIIKSAGCCNERGGRLVLGQATVGSNSTITVEGHEEGTAPVETVAGSGTKDGWLSFDVEGKTTIVNASIINNGQITFGRFDRTITGDVKTTVLLNGSIQNKKNMTIFYAGDTNTSNDDAKLAVSASGVLQNENGAEFTIEGELYFDGTGYNKGIINDRVSSQVTGKISSFKCDPSLAGNEYICDVNDPGKRFNDALVSVYKPTTIVRFVETAKTYDFAAYEGKEKGKYNSIKKYIVAVGEDRETIFKGSNITLPELKVEAYNVLKFNSITDASKKAVWTNLTVSGNLTVDGKIESVKGTVPDGANKTFEGVEKLTINNFILNGIATLSNKTVDVTKVFAINNTKNASSIEGTTVTVGSTTDKGGLLDIQGLVTLKNNTDVLVYGDVNAGKDAVATIVEATGSTSAMPATVTYSGKNTYSNILTNWPKGGPSKMIQ